MPGHKERREAWAAEAGEPSAQGRRGSCPGRGRGCRRRLAYRAFVLAAQGGPGRSLRRRGTGWDLPGGELGAPGGHPSRQRAMLGRWPASRGEGSSWDGAPPSRPSPAPGASARRNFRKHLRMVGSRRVKAQSKARERRRGRAGARCSCPAGASRAALRAPKAPPRPRCGPAGTFPLPGSAPGQGPAPAPRLRPCAPSTVLVRCRPSALPTPAPPAAVASSTPRTPSRSPRPPPPAPAPVHLVRLQARPLTGSAFAAAFAERRERSFSRSWSDPTPMKADTSHDSRDSRCPAAQARTPLPEAPLGPQSCAPTPGGQLGFCAFAEPQFTRLTGGGGGALRHLRSSGQG